MNKPLNILLVIDGDTDDRALLAELESIVTDQRAHVSILSVADPVPAKADKSVAVSNLQEWEAKVRSMQLDDLSSALSKMGVSVSIDRAVGKTHLEVIRRTLAADYDLVIKLAMKDVGIRELLLGGTDMQLLSLCPVPVWIVQPTANRKIERIGVAIDLSPNDPERTALADNILKWGVRTAELAAAELHIIHVWSLYREATLRSRPASAYMVDNLLQGKEQLHGKWLGDALERVQPHNLEINRHLVKGDAKQLISRMADDLKLDLLIMGTVGRTGIPGFFIGNTADTVLRQVGCSVLAIKPANFVTPVKPQPASS